MKALAMTPENGLSDGERDCRLGAEEAAARQAGRQELLKNGVAEAEEKSPAMRDSAFAVQKRRRRPGRRRYRRLTGLRVLQLYEVGDDT